MLSKFASPKARAKSASVALTLFQQTCSNKQTVQSSKAVGSKAKQNRERLAGDAFIWTCPVCAWDVRADSSDKCSNDRCKHAQKTHPQVLHHRFRLAGLLCQWSKLQPIGPLTNFTAPRKEASGTKRQGPHGNLPASQKAVSNRTSKAKSKGDTVHKHRFKKLSQPNAKHWIVSFSLHLAQRGILWWRLISPLWYSSLPTCKRLPELQKLSWSKWISSQIAAQRSSGGRWLLKAILVKLTKSWKFGATSKSEGALACASKTQNASVDSQWEGVFGDPHL